MATYGCRCLMTFTCMRTSCCVPNICRDQVFKDEGKDVVPGVWEVLDKIKAFSQKVSSTFWAGCWRQ